MDRLPCEYWIKFLLSKEPAFSFTQVRDAVLLRGFPAPSDAYLSALAMSLESTKPQPFDPCALHCVRWLKKQKVYDISIRKASVARAAELLSSAVARKKIEALLTGGVDNATILAILQEHHGKILTDEELTYYRHYFWNPDVMTVDSWKALTELYPNGGHLWSIYISADPKTALLSIGETLNLRSEDMLQYVTDRAFANYHVVSSGDPADREVSTSANTWANIALRGIEIQEKRKSSTDLAVQMLQALLLKYSDDEPMSLEELQRTGEVIQIQGPKDG